jgi:hypothetical protein
MKRLLSALSLPLLSGVLQAQTLKIAFTPRPLLIHPKTTATENRPALKPKGDLLIKQVSSFSLFFS